MARAAPAFHRFFNVLVDNNPLVQLDGTASSTKTEYTFSFVGTGSDTLTLTGNTNIGHWYVYDTSVVETAAPVAKPSTCSLLLAVCILFGGFGMVQGHRLCS